MNSYDFILFCFAKHLFSLYICLVIFIFRLIFYCEFMNLQIKQRLPRKRRQTPGSFSCRLSLQLKVYNVFSPGIVHHGSWNQLLSVRLFFCSPHLRLRWQVGVCYVTLSLELRRTHPWQLYTLSFFEKKHFQTTLKSKTERIGHFRVALNLIVKASLSAIAVKLISALPQWSCDWQRCQVQLAKIHR